MALNKAKGNMYPWVSHTHGILAGACQHACRYCYAAHHERRYGTGCFDGPPRLRKGALRVNYGAAAVLRYAKERGLARPCVFVEHMNDLWAENVPVDIIAEVLNLLIYWDGLVDFVFQTKNPSRYQTFLKSLPSTSTLGCTIETNRLIPSHISMAPEPVWRMVAMASIGATARLAFNNFGAGSIPMSQTSRRAFPIFLTIEPIMDFDVDVLLEWMQTIHPNWVNIGADSKHSRLPEPPREKVVELIDGLGRLGIEIRAKHNLGRIMGEGVAS